MAALADRFGAAGFELFDYTFGQRPATMSADPKWGGYRIQFKIIERSKHGELSDDIEAVRRNATVIGPAQQRTFTIYVSKWEFCEGKVETELDDFTIFVYTPAMLAVEKIRALCQQMNEYPARGPKTARARDFYDVFVILEESKIDVTTEANNDLVQTIFAAKEVPLGLMGLMDKYREFHRLDWPSVEATVTEGLKSFDFYFDYLLGVIGKLESLWKE